MTVAVDQLSLHGTPEPLPRWVRLLDTAALALLVTAVLLIPGDGIRFGIGPIRISIVSAARVAMWAALVIVARHAFYRTRRSSGSRRRLASQWRRMARRQVRWPGPARDPSPSDPDRSAGRRDDRHRRTGRLSAIREPAAQPARADGMPSGIRRLPRSATPSTAIRCGSRASCSFRGFRSRFVSSTGSWAASCSTRRGSWRLRRSRSPSTGSCGWPTPPRREVGCGQRVAAGELSVRDLLQRALHGGPVPARVVFRLSGHARAAVRIRGVVGSGRRPHPAERVAAGDPDRPAGV